MVVMFCPKLTHSGPGALKNAAYTCLASSISASVSWLLGYTQWVLAL